MKILHANRRVTGAISTVLLCLSASRCCFVQAERAELYHLDKGLVFSAPTVETKTCEGSDSPLEFRANDTHRIFQFKCQANAKLHPVEKDDGARTKQDPSEEKLATVYVFTPDNKLGKAACAAEHAQSLSALVPGSTLAVIKNTERNPAQQETGSDLEFRLALGPAPTQDRYLCYTCTPGGDVRTGACSIHITVPGKKPVPDQNQDHSPDDQLPPTPDSGSFHPIADWLAPSVAGCALGLMLLH